MATYCYNCMNPIEAGTTVCPHCGQSTRMVSPAHQLKPGTILLERYMVGKALGQGGFGITYIGLDTRLEMRVAIKEFYPNGYSNRNHEVTDNVTITAADAERFYSHAIKRFLHEAKTLAKFNNEPGIVGVRDFFEANNTAYIVMDYLEGITLKKYISSKGPIRADILFPLMTPIINGLGKVHEAGIVHRDVSPDNIMVMPSGLKLLDFGAARKVDDEKSLSVMLKPGFAPEEQYRSKGKQGPWTDVYALCATMYYCLSGVRPDEATERLWEDKLKRLSELGVKISPAEESVILRGMSVRASDRYQTMGELSKALAAAQQISSYERDQASRAKTEHNTSLQHKPDPEPVKKRNEQPVKEQTSQPESKKDFGDIKIASDARHLLKPDEVRALKTKKRRQKIKKTAIAVLLIALIFGVVKLLKTAANHAGQPRETAAVSHVTATPKPTAAPVTASPKPVDADALYEEGKKHIDNCDYAAALDCFMKSAAAGCTDAMNSLGDMYSEGQGVVIDYAKAMEWYQRAVASSRNAKAMQNLGWLYANGAGIERDYTAAMNWFRKAAELDNADALYSIAELYIRGQGVKQDAAEASNWYEKAFAQYQKDAERGDADGMNSLGDLYFEAKGVQRDYAKALEWYRKAADKGEKYAMRNTAYCYENGYGTDKDEATAEKWYKQAMQRFRTAAQAGDAASMYVVADMYYGGAGVQQDNRKAMEWLLKAAEIGSSDAMNAIGIFYLGGLGVTQDYWKAMEWYQKAADAGNTAAMYNIAYMYENGMGVPANNTTAREWYQKAADAGDEDAKAKLAQ